MPANRIELKEYCLRKLGDPVIKINVADEQVEDRIDEALQIYKEYHPNGSERMFYVHTITQTDIDNKYIDIDSISPRIINITRLIEMNSGAYSKNFMNDIYQYKLNLHKDLLYTGNAADYYIGMQHLEVINRVFESGKVIEYNRVSDKLRIMVDWSNFIPDESTIAFECFEIVGDSNVKLFDQKLLKDLSFNLIKQQWGENLKKHKGVVLVGGVEIDGQGIYDEATDKLEKIMEELEDSPLPVFFG